MKYQTNPDHITDRVKKVMRTAGFFDTDDANSAEENGKSRGETHQARPKGLRKASIRDFHSFRHTWKTYARGAKLTEEVHDEISGHETGSVGRTYGKFPIPTLKEYVDAVQIDVSIPKWTP